MKNTTIEDKDMKREYAEFIKKKEKNDIPSGFECHELSDMLFPFQRDIVKWALKRGRAAIFANTGLGKTAMQLEWANRVSIHTNKPVLIVAPLAVSSQTVRESEKFGIKSKYIRNGDDLEGFSIFVTNYEMLDNFDADLFGGVVLDESSILKNRDGKTRKAIIDKFIKTPYRLSCTATPSPNDFMELGNQSEFLGIMPMTEMLAMFFTHDGGETSKWRLKGHGAKKFWQWMATWAATVTHPSDLGYIQDGYDLPPLKMHEHQVSSIVTCGELFPKIATTLQERREAKKETLDDRVKVAADIVNNSKEFFIVWCHTNDESSLLSKAIPDAIEIVGSDTPEKKEKALIGFSNGEYRVLVTKPSIAGFGMNWQHCANMVFVGLDDSYEQFYQAVRRCYRFGQNREVNVHIITAESLGAIKSNIERKDKQMKEMQKNMVSHMSDAMKKEIHGATIEKNTYKRDVFQTDDYTLHLGDCVDVCSGFEDNSIGYTIFSPPFASLYVYSNSDFDMGNVKNDDEFYNQFKFLIEEMYRVTKPGRLLSFHCMNLPTSKVNDGVIGIRDFRGELIKLFIDAGWIFHSEVCIWKDPVTAMQRTKALGLLHKQIKKDSAMSRQGIPDYLVTMRKPGDNMEPIENTNESFPVQLWQQYASPVWMDINPSRTLNYRGGRENDDERHICPLQLDVIERALKLWSKEGDLVYSPFCGIGSEGYCAVRMGRRFVGSELKESYWNLSIKNLSEAKKETYSLFN